MQINLDVCIYIWLYLYVYMFNFGVFMYVLMFDDATYWYSQLDNTVDSISLLYHVFICTYTYIYVYM